MSTFTLIPGAGGVAWYWSRVVPLLEAAGHRAIAAEGEPKQRPQAETIFAHACRFRSWPAVPIHVIAGRDDRLFPPDFQRRVARERLHVDVDELPGGHLIALANPRGLVNQLLGYLR